ncbi:27848_t:CDS:2 [Dentiscutata erythropus]|uniref:27848_t:CDS:1 n=1 Tax=Dentiscutata erythropus TaxID=1348616 RepID=A0A9N9FUG0_9GLOM|nr:27848_t:CDS:2 [Dentiscutata erythropus]
MNTGRFKQAVAYSQFEELLQSSPAIPKNLIISKGRVSDDTIATIYIKLARFAECEI